MRSTVSRPLRAGRPAKSRGFDAAREATTAPHASYLLAKGGSDHLIAACVSAAAGLSEFQPTDLRPNVGNRTATFTRHPRSNDSDYSLPRRGGSVGGAMTLRQECPRTSLGGNLRSKTPCLAEVCNSHYVSHFAAFFIVARAKISVAESCSRVCSLDSHRIIQVSRSESNPDI